MSRSLTSLHRTALLLSLAVLAGVVASAAHAAVQSGPAFAAVSVKRNTSGNAGSSTGFRGNHYSASNVTIRRLIVSAYGILDSQLVVGPSLAAPALLTN